MGFFSAGGFRARKQILHKQSSVTVRTAFQIYPFLVQGWNQDESRCRPDTLTRVGKWVRAGLRASW